MVFWVNICSVGQLIVAVAPLLISLGLLTVLCGGKKKRHSNAATTGRSNISSKSVQTPGSKSTDDMLKTCVDSGVGGGKLQLGEDTNERGTTTENKTDRISLHGAVHNTDTFASAEQIDGEAKLPSIEVGIDQEKAAPGKVSLKTKEDKQPDASAKAKSLMKEQQTQPSCCEMTAVTGSLKDVKSKSKKSVKTPNEEPTQKTLIDV